MAKTTFVSMLMEIFMRSNLPDETEARRVPVAFVLQSIEISGARPDRFIASIGPTGTKTHLLRGRMPGNTDCPPGRCTLRWVVENMRFTNATSLAMQYGQQEESSRHYRRGS
jgi:hypothetical protein